ncbi:helix-turn-helix domain-containing protein [Clostridium felsineum]|nr:helix-turn-helix domain-containing protein [Clostridium felsineum]
MFIIQGDIMNSLGETVKKLRKEKGWSLNILSAKSKIPISTLHGIEKGSNPSFEKITALANAFDVSIDDLVEDTKIEINNKPLVSDKKISKEIGLNIKKFREEKKMTQKELANIINSDETVIQLYESGYKGINSATLKKISIALGVTQNQLLESEFYKSIEDISNLCQKYIDDTSSNAFEGIKSLVTYASLEDEFNEFLNSKPSNEEISNLLNRLSEFLEFELFKIKKDR